MGSGQVPTTPGMSIPDALNGLTRCIQIGVPIRLVGFEIGALTPLVPGIDEDEGVFQILSLLRLLEDIYQPVLIEFR